tara:strand:- start:23492 stop:24991 length:1500 start_codon:yes stop_codon:yes gene_type:complete
MRSFEVAKIDRSTLSADHQHYVYNGLDAAITLEVLHVLRNDCRPYAHAPYLLARQLQAPAIEMMLRGVLVDPFRVKDWQHQLNTKKAKLQSQLDFLALADWNRPLNPNSPAQLKEFFYVHHRLPEQHKFDKGTRKVSTDQTCLDKLTGFVHVRPFISHIRAIRDCIKKLGVLNTGIDKDSRMRAAFNIAGTETGRWSSSSGAYGSGTNLQNITEELRRVFWADPGYKLAYIDLEQAESFLVGGLVYESVGDPSYLNACESGDLHTSVAKLIWPGLAWTGDRKADRAVADVLFYLHFSYRDMAKRGGHGTNYYGQPKTMAKHLKVPVELVVAFQENYFSAFPGIPLWHKHVKQQLQLTGYIETPFHRGRHFFERLTDDATLREAIAFNPQSSIGDLLNTALLYVWRKHRNVQILIQVHDAILIQYPEEQEDEIIPAVQKTMDIPLRFKDREVHILTEAAIGWNWSYASATNPDGLKKWKGHDSRVRTESPSASLLDRQFL